MKKRRTIFSLVVLIAVSVQVSYGQVSAESLKRLFTGYSATHLQEKLFVHTDKDFYVAGEIIWFKLYAADAQLNRPLDLSRIGYVEVLSHDNKPVLQTKIALIDGSGNGSFQLPYSINSGNYTMRAYTAWMKNENTELFFAKEITIVNALKKPEWPALQAANYDVQFFPEGGDLIHGIESRIAYKIIDQDGAGVNCRGAVLNRRNDTVARFSAQRFGMGHFVLTPDAGEEYKAVIVSPQGTVVTRSLPAIRSTGVAMHLAEVNGRLRLAIHSSHSGELFSVLVHTRQSLKLSFTAELFNGAADIDIDPQKLGEGISQFTLFNAAGQPVCERLYFRKPGALMVSAVTDAANYSVRKKVAVTISTSDNQHTPLAGDLSMAVFRLDSLQSPASSDILSYLWLQSDLRGNIESPEFYFSTDPDAARAADDLMLTQGWRRFRWENVMKQQSTTPEFLPETEGHIINGRVIDKRTGAGTPGIQAYLSVPAERSLFTGAVSGKNGSIQFNVKDFYGGNEVILQPAEKADSNYRIDIISPFSEKYSTRQLLPFAVSEKHAALLQAHSLGAQTGNAYFGEKQQKFLFPRVFDTTSFYGIPDHTYYLDDYTRFTTMEEVMREYVSDVRVRKNNGHFSYRINNLAFNTLFETAPLVLMDGVPVSDIDQVMAFDPMKVKRIDVVAQRFYQHGMIHEGIINYSTYQGDLAGYQPDPNALIIEYGGVQLQREFYSPVYETSAVNNRIPDLRNVLYWSPEIRTGKDGKTQLSFYTADIPGTYAVIVQGMAANGLAGSVQSSFVVVK